MLNKNLKICCKIWSQRVEEEQLRVALKKAHEIRSKLDDFILHLSEMYRISLEVDSKLFERNQENSQEGFASLDVSEQEEGQ